MRGYTLIQVSVALLVVGVASIATVPGILSYTDRLACIAAREELAALVDRARAEATVRGGAAFVLDADSAVAWVEWAGSQASRTDLHARYGVSTQLSSSRSMVRVPFDRMGLGRFASQTIHVSRGRGSAALVLSSYGRIRRQ